MFACIAGVLDSGLLASVRGLLGGARFADGAATAGWHARLVKNNDQAATGQDAVREAAAAEIAPYRAKMPAMQVKQVQQQFLQKRLMEARGLPRLSLFYMSHG